MPCPSGQNVLTGHRLRSAAGGGDKCPVGSGHLQQAETRWLCDDEETAICTEEVPALVRAIFDANYLVVSFGYGLVYVLLGFAVALTIRHTPGSHLRMAGCLRYLSYFGLFYGFSIWGQTFIPLQAPFLSAGIITILQIVQVLGLAVGLCCLGLFGFTLLARLERGPAWLPAVPVITGALWLSGFLLHTALGGPLTGGAWLALWEALARYLLAVPGALASGLAVLYQIPAVVLLGLPRVRRHLIGAAAAFGLFALTAGLVVPAGALERTGLLTVEGFFTLTQVPIEVVRGLIGFLLAYCMTLAFEVFAVEVRRRIIASDRRGATLEERHRIGQELQDGVIQVIYAANLYVELAQGLVETDPAEARQQLKAAQQHLDGAVRHIRTYILEGGPLPLTLSQNNGSSPAADSAED